MTGIDSRYEHNIGDTIRPNPDLPPDKIVARMSGNFGAVYVAQSEDPDIGITALKTIRADLEIDSQIIEDFTNEARLWINLPDHPCILPAYTVRRYHQKPYIRMKYVPPINQFGCSVYALLTGLRLIPSKKEFIGLPTDETIIYFLSQILGVLHILEKELDGFYHGDIKPSNLLLEGIEEKYPRILLSDFGLARAHTSRVSKGPRFIGDVGYLAPEVLDGRQQDTLSDIYAIGCTMLEMITGSKYQRYDTATQRLMFEDSTSLISNMKTIRPNFPEPISQLILSCVEKDFHRRPQSMHELFERFKQAIEKIGGEIKEIRLQREQSPFYKFWGDEHHPVIKYLVEVKGIERTRSERIVQLISDAARLRAVGNIGKAEELINDVLDDIPDFPSALIGKAHAFLLSNNPIQAVQLYLRAIQLYLSDEELRSVDGSGFNGACITAAQILPQVTSNHELLQLAMHLAKKGTLLEPKEPRAYLALGMCCRAVGDVEGALEALRIANEIDPNNRVVKLNLIAVTAWSRRDKKDVLPKLAEQYGLNPNEVNAAQFLLDKWEG